jgi:hypothetical protein
MSDVREILSEIGACLKTMGDGESWGGEDPMPRWAPKCITKVWDGKVPADMAGKRSLLLHIAADLVSIAVGLKEEK